MCFKGGCSRWVRSLIFRVRHVKPQRHRGFLCAFVSLWFIQTAPVQHIDIPKRPIPLRTGIGKAHDPVSTTSQQAQAFYDQGLAYLHSYAWIEAARSFNQALREDPKLALAQVGLSYAYIELNDSAAAQAAIEKAIATNDHDRRHI